MIGFSGVNKRLGSFSLQDISFSLKEGTICGLVGRNGAGKTTILNLIMGLLRPDEGTITIDGMSYREAENEIHALLGYVPVDELFWPGVSIRENAGYFGGFYERFEADIYEKLLEEFRLSPEKKFRTLSKGEKLKCQFAFALAIRPKYLILDEPTANFDPAFREAFWEHLKDFTSDGEGAVLLATHLTDDLDRMADELLFLDRGRSIFAGDMESFRDSYRILSGETYLIRLIDKERVLGMEEGKYGSKALAVHRRHRDYPEGLIASPPTIEEFMYLYSRGTQI